MKEDFKMAKLIWQIVPFKGIETHKSDVNDTTPELQIFFGMNRQEIRKLLADVFPKPEKKNFPDEDDFVSKKGKKFVRLSYDENDKLVSILVIEGRVQYQNIELKEGTTMPKIIKQLEKINISAQDPEYADGYDFPQLGINIATHEDVGGDGDEIEYVSLTKDFPN